MTDPVRPPAEDAPGPGEPASGLRRSGCAAALGRAAIVLLWIGLAIAILEATAIWRMRVVAERNPYLIAFRDNTPLPLPSNKPSLTGMERLPTDTPMLPWLLPEPPRRDGLDAYRLLPGTDTDTEKPSGHAAFDALDDSGREMFAALHREVVVSIDGEGRGRLAYGANQAVGLTRYLRIRAAWSSWRRRDRLQAWLADATADTRPSGSLPEMDLWLRDSSRPVSLHPSLDDGTAAHWFVPIMPTAIKLALMESEPEDSRWRTPHLYFRPGYQEDRPPGAGDFRINRHGYRSPEIVIPKPPGTIRILCIGGSTTEEGSQMAGTYPSQLETRLRARFPGQTIEVVNAGVSGITSTGHLWKFPEYLALEPDIIIAYSGINDIALDALPAYRWLHAPAWTHLIRYFHAARHWEPVDFSPAPEAIEPQLDAGLFLNLAALGRGAAAHGIPLVICSVAHPDPSMLSDDEAGYIDFLARNQWGEPYMGLTRYVEYITMVNARLEALAGQEGQLFIPVAAHLRGGTELFGDICHMTDDGIALKAEIIYRYLVGE